MIVDCDPGHDDALAIVLALARPELRLLAITTVAGNAPLDRTTRNALRVLTLLGRTDVTAVELLSTLLRDAADPVTLVATGPLTNVALLMRSAPALHERIAAISLMGGSLGAGNITPAAEFNIWADPDAAAIVFASGIPIRGSARFSLDEGSSPTSAGTTHCRIGR